MKQIITVVMALLLPGLLSAAEPQTLKMKIEGMTCGMCEAKVKKQLSSLCKEITIDREKGEGICKYGSPATADQIIQEANKTGFKTSKLN
ncbi:MAG: heavy-metal-associated domain-containing protein [Deltaproteobacteria bacterium]|nr:heavy-metal-associated domain-containing protein [Deltaproteobacteria bacterium]